MGLANATPTDHAGPAQPSAVAVEDGIQTIQLRGPVPDWLAQADRAWTSGAPALAAELLGETPLQAIQQQLAVDPARVDLLYMLGKLLMNLGRHAQALSIYQEIATLEPAAVACHLLSEVLHALGRVSEALPWAQKAHELDPEHPDYMARLAHCLFYTGRVQAAVDMMSRACVLRPENRCTSPML